MKLPSRRVLATTVTVVLFLSGAAAIYGFLFQGAGIRAPWNDRYTVAVLTQDADNLVKLTAVRTAGVHVGEVIEVSNRGAANRPARVVFALEDDVAPLHEGATVRIGIKSVLGESYLDVQDGDGAPIESGSTLRRSAVNPSTQLRDVYHSLDPKTRDSMQSMIRSLGKGTKGTEKQVSATLAGLGRLGREGYTALNAVAAQSDDLRALARQTTTMLRALDTGAGRIATMVSSAQQLTEATAGQRGAIEATMRRLPDVLASAEEATAAVTDLSAALAPVAANLQKAAPALSTALRQLPATANDLRGSLPALDGTLKRAPATLRRVPTFGSDVRSLIPDARLILRDVNPALSYLQPYALDFASFVANFSASMAYTDEAGNNWLRLIPKINLRSVESPVEAGVFTYKNPYPPPLNGGADGPFTGKYPRVERAPR